MEKHGKRILFAAEAVTLAHVARPHVLAQALAKSNYEVIFACDPRYERLFSDAHYHRCSLSTISSERFRSALSRGSPLYDFSTLCSYVQDDLSLIDRLRPDAIVADFRLSMSVSARLRGVPLLAISNAYWSPFYSGKIPVPDLPFVRWVGRKWGQRIFDALRPVAFRLHARPMNKLRKKYDLPPLPPDMRHAYSDADELLFADIPGMVPLTHSPTNHHFLGPINWSPATPAPLDWAQLIGSRPLVYVTLGSSGDPGLLPSVISALQRHPLSLLVATAGTKMPGGSDPHLYITDFASGKEATLRAAFVVCNGGSPTTHQALTAGVPVIGIPSNLDQWLNMEGIVTVGAGMTVAPDKHLKSSLYHAAGKIQTQSYALSAARLQRAIEQFKPLQIFSELLERTLQSGSGYAQRPVLPQ